jgi:flavorubredoxin
MNKRPPAIELIPTVTILRLENVILQSCPMNKEKNRQILPLLGCIKTKSNEPRPIARIANSVWKENADQKEGDVQA